jgi:hypothetical protein
MPDAAARDAIEMRRATIHYYGCCRCQDSHDQGTPLYLKHLAFQEKHGIKTRPGDQWVRNDA